MMIRYFRVFGKRMCKSWELLNWEAVINTCGLGREVVECMMKDRKDRKDMKDRKDRKGLERLGGA